MNIVRTGYFRYVPYSRIEDFHRLGWMVERPLGSPHEEYSVLMWHCECKALLDDGTVIEVNDLHPSNPLCQKQEGGR